MHNEELMIFIC